MLEQHAIINFWALKANPAAAYKTSGTKAQGGGLTLEGIHPNSPLQLADLIYRQLKLAKINKGTDDDALDKLPKHPLVTALKAYRKAAKAYGTYVKSLHEQVSDDGRVHSTYLIHGTPTGRLASRGPNMQNQPRGPRIRSQFVAAPGFEIGEFDLSQAELRCLAVLSGDKALCHIYQTAGLSLHKEVSLYMSETGRIKPNWKQRYAINDNNDPIYVEAYDEYMRIKALNFGIVYGRTAPSIAEEFSISVAQAQAMINGWGERFPDAWKYIDKCRMAPLRGQNMYTPFGRRKRVGVVSRDALTDLQNEAANFPHQSIASDITLTAAARVRLALRARGVKIVNLIHDAILCEIPLQEGYFDRTARLVTSTLTQVPLDMGLSIVPFVSDAKRGDRWGDLKEYEFIRDPQTGDWGLDA
jgi:DNA polymerase-1